MEKVENFRVFYRIPGTEKIYVEAFEEMGFCVDRLLRLRNINAQFRVFAYDTGNWNPTGDEHKVSLLNACINSGAMPIIYRPATC